VAGELAAALRAGDVVALYGPLGAGKTEFVRGAAISLGVREGVRSPGYTLVNEYHGRLPVFHVDLYRVGSARDLESLGLEEYLEGPGVVFIEWAERAEELLPEGTVKVDIAFGPEADQRVITVSWRQSDRRDG